MLPPDEYTMWLERTRTGKNVEELDKFYSVLIQRVKRIDPITIAETTDGEYRGGDGIPRVVIPFLHSWFVLELLPYRIQAGHEVVDTLPMKVLALQHLIAAAENQGTAVRVMGEWIDCRSLRHGAVMGAHFSKTTSALLNRYFSLARNPTDIPCAPVGWKTGGSRGRGIPLQVLPEVACRTHSLARRRRICCLQQNPVRRLSQQLYAHSRIGRAY